MSLNQNQLWEQVTGSGTDEAAKGLIVEFEMVAVEDEKASAEQGRPVYVDKEFIRKRSPNDPLSEVHRAVEAKDLKEFPQAYKRWKDGAQEALVGTPLKEWAPIAGSQCQMLALRGVRTVEQFSELTDDACHQIGQGFLTLRNKANAYLKKAAEGADATRFAVAMTEKDKEIASLQRQLSELIQRMDRQDDSPPPKKSRNQQPTT